MKDFATIEVYFNTCTANFKNNLGNVSNYTTASFHIHAPSEHSFNGLHYDLEMHVVHTDDTSGGKKLGVTAIFFDTKKGGNSKNDFIDSLQFDNF